MKKVELFSLIIPLIALSVSAFADPMPKKAPSMLVCYTTGSVNRRQAKKATQSMLDVLEELAGWKKGGYQSNFTTKRKECEGLLASENVHFVSPDLGFYLEHSKDLIPIARPVVKGKSGDKWYVIVKKGVYSSLNDLKGKTIGGPLVEDAEFLKHVVFAGKIDPKTFFVLKPSHRVLRALRKLHRGKLDAVLLNQQQYDALPSLPFAKDLAVAFTSKKIPVPSILAVKARTTAKERKAFAKALSKFCDNPKGKGFCKMFGIDKFVPVEKGFYQGVKRLWSK